MHQQHWKAFRVAVLPVCDTMNIGDLQHAAVVCSIGSWVELAQLRIVPGLLRYLCCAWREWRCACYNLATTDYWWQL